MQQHWEQIVSGEARGVGAGLARLGLGAAAALYRVGLRANLFIYQGGLRRQTQPELPVVSVGNLTLGGTGKTTTAAFLARRLAQWVKVGLVLRGHGREAGEAVTLVSDGEGEGVRASLAEAGDEAWMLTRLLPGCAVAVGKRREAVIAALGRRAGVQAAVLDDGFQYFRMARAADLVLMDALADTRAWRLFPAGRLREPLQNLRRADQVWITHADVAGPERVAALRQRIAGICPGMTVVTTSHRPGALRPLSPGPQAPPNLAGKRVLALSALGNPEAFEAGLAGLGAQVIPVRFPDHHAYAAEDYRRVRAVSEGQAVEAVITTEKDAVKLPPPPEDLPPVLVLGCELAIVEGADEVESLLERLRGLCSPAGGGAA